MNFFDDWKNPENKLINQTYTIVLLELSCNTNPFFQLLRFYRIPLLQKNFSAFPSGNIFPITLYHNFFFLCWQHVETTKVRKLMVVRNSAHLWIFVRLMMVSCLDWTAAEPLNIRLTGLMINLVKVSRNCLKSSIILDDIKDKTKVSMHSLTDVHKGS